MITSPIASHALARASHKSGARMAEETTDDAYAKTENSAKEEEK